MAPRKSAAQSAKTTRKTALDKMVARLDGGRLYTLGELFHEVGVPLEGATAQALARRATVVARNVGRLGEEDLASLYVVARQAAERAMGRDEVLISALRRRAGLGAMRAHTAAQLGAMVSPRDEKSFRAALEARARDRRWPQGVGTLHGLNQRLIFLMEDIAGGAVETKSETRPEREPVAKPEAKSNGKGFAHAFGEAFDELRKQRGVNLVELSALRAALSGYPREVFDQELYALRRDNQFVLDTFDGRHGKLKAEELSGAIEEGGRRYVYASRRNT